MNPPDTIFSVANYITLINEQLKFYKAKVIGEVTKVNIYPSGHVYFTIKDKEEGAVLDCILWKRTYLLYGIRLESVWRLSFFFVNDHVNQFHVRVG